MRSIHLRVGRRAIFFVILAAVSVPLVNAQPSADPAQIARLVEQLGSGDFDQREEAARGLDKLGAPALEALRKAVDSSDLEVRRLAQELNERIVRRMDSASALVPNLIRLNYKDTTLNDALRDLRARSGFNVRLADGDANLGGRLITLDTGATTFWKALDQFEAAAGLKEQPSRLDVVPRNTINLGRPVGESSTEQPEILLQDGRAGRPTCYSGTLCVRALETEAALNGLKKAPGEALLGLEVLAEPGVRVRGVFGVLINRAIDEHGQTLCQRQGTPERKEIPAPVGRTNVVIGGVPLDFDRIDNPDNSPRRVSVRLVTGEKPATTLKELSGILVTQMRTLPRTLATVDGVLQAANRSVAGPDGCSVKVVSIEQPEKGSVRLVARVEPPEIPPAPENAELERLRQVFGRGGVRIRGAILIGGRAINFGDAPTQAEEVLTAANFTLLDAQGQALETVQVTATGKTAGRAHEYELTFRAKSGQGEAAKFVYIGPRVVQVDVPFTLKDVPLP
jgi:hypothetical protein